MRFLRVFKIVFLYIGTVIGAGFGTGRELVAFFKDTSPITLILGGLCLGLFCSYYLYLGKAFNSDDLSKIVFNKYCKIFDFIVAVSIFFVLSAMFDTADIMVNDIFGLKYGGYFTVAVCLVSAIIGIGFIKQVNFVVIPAIVIMIIFIFSMHPIVEFTGRISLMSPISYAGMNIMLAGYVTVKDGKELSNKEIALSGGLVGVIFAVIMVLLYEMVKGSTAVMPFYEVAVGYGYKYMAGFIIYFAILTTTLSAVSIVLDYTNNFIINKYLCAILIFILAIPVKKYLGFGKIVEYVYPVVSFIGIFITIVSLIKLIKIKIQSKKDKKSKKDTNYI